MLRRSLPARFAVVARGTAITVLIATPATAIATAAATIAATATTSTAITAAGSISARPRFIHGQVASGELFAVKLFDRRGSFFRRGHFDKAKAARATRHPIFHD